MPRCLALCACLSVALYGPTLHAADAPDTVAQAVQRFVDQGVIAGAVTLVAADGKVKSLEAIGMADLESHRPMTPDTLFWIASMTKPITATSLMLLVDEGEISLDTPAGMFLPEFNAITVAGDGSPAKPVTIRHLLSHTSGVAGPGKSSSSTPTLAETAESIADTPLQFEPGSQWKYGNGLTVAGRIVEIASGQSFDAFVRDRILQPLGMNDTTFDPTPAQRTRLATIYSVDKATKELKPVTTGAFANVDATGPRKAPNPSGGLASTANDYFRFLQMILNGGQLDGQRIVSEEAVRQMTTPQTGDLKAGFVPGSQWGLGWGIVQKPEGVTAVLSPGTFGHGGAFGTQAWVDPKLHGIYILLIQRVGLQNSDGSEIREAFQASARPLLGK